MPGKVGTCQWEYFSQVLSEEFSRMCCFLSHRDLCRERSDIWKMKQRLLPTRMMMSREQHPSPATATGWGPGQRAPVTSCRALQGSPESPRQRRCLPLAGTQPLAASRMFLHGHLSLPGWANREISLHAGSQTGDVAG